MPNVEIPEEVLQRLAAVKRGGDPRKAIFEPWQDEVLLKYWKHQDYKQTDVAKIIGYSINPCRTRYEELTVAESALKREPTTGFDSGDTEGVQRGRDKAARPDRASYKGGST